MTTALLFFLIFAGLQQPTQSSSIAGLQQPTQSSSIAGLQQPIQSSSIAGLVVSVEGQPLRGARVVLRLEGSNRREAEYGTVTGAGGRFELKDIGPGRYSLAVTMPGYVRQVYGQRRPAGAAAVLDLNSPQAVRELRISLVPGGTIAGRVFNEDGQPLQRAVVQALLPRYVKGVRQLVMAATANTDDLGEYRMYWTPPGDYYLLATPPGPADNDAISARVEQFEGGSDKYTHAFFPNARDEAGARRLRLAPGAELRGVDFVLTRVSAVRLRGRVLQSSAGAPVAGAVVSVRSQSSAAAVTFTTVTGPDGAFELRNVIPGAYTLHAVSDGPGGGTAMFRREIYVGEKDVDDIEVALQPPLELEGRVWFTGGDSTPSRLTLSLNAAEGGGYAAVQPDGTFLTSALAPSQYRLEIAGLPDTHYVRAARMGRTDVLRDGIDLREGVGDILEVEISTGASIVEGAAVDREQRPQPGVQVVLIPPQASRDRIDLFKTATTDQLGRFEIRGVAPGQYTVLAWEDIEPGAYFDPSVLQQYETSGATIHVGESSRVNVAPRVIPAF